MAETSGEKSVRKWNTWLESMTDHDYILMMTDQGKLDRTKVANGCGFSKSVLGSNPRVKAMLEELETKLRERGILPELISKSEEEDSEPLKTDKESLISSMDQSRVTELEKCCTELKAENNVIKVKLGRFSEIIDVYADLDEL